MAKLKIRIAPDPILHQKSQPIKVTEVKSAKVRKLVQDIKDTLKSGEYGVGMSSIQVGIPLAIAVIMIRPTPTRPNLKQLLQRFACRSIQSIVDLSIACP